VTDTGSRGDEGLKKNVLVTGGAGFIGSHIVERLYRDWQVIVFDNLSSGDKSNIEDMDARFIEGDIREQKALTEACNDVGVVFHLAAMISVTESMESPETTVQTNTLGTLNLLRAAQAQGVETIVFSSSSAIYGDNPASQKNEEMIPEPGSPYAVSKLDGEYFLRIYRELYGINTVSLRYFNVFGPRQSPASAYAAVIPSFLHRAIRGEDIIVYGSGTQTRDFVYVEDVVRANLLAAGLVHADLRPEDAKLGHKAGSYGNNVYNVASGFSLSVNDLAKEIKDITGSKSNVIHATERAGDVKHSLADISRIQRDLGFKPLVSLQEGLRRTAVYFTSRHNVQY